jgi:hypothetical protein
VSAFSLATIEYAFRREQFTSPCPSRFFPVLDSVRHELRVDWLLP